MFQFHHISLSVTNLERSVAFYSCLNFQECLRWSSPDYSVHISHLKLGSFFLELFCYQKCMLNNRSSDSLELDLPIIGIKHLALQVTSLVEARTILLQKGFAEKLQIRKGRMGIDYLFIRDPDGIFIEIVEDKGSWNAVGD